VADALAELCKDIPDLPPKSEKRCEVLVRNNTADLMEELGEMVNARCVHAGAGWCECLGLGFRLVGMFGFRV
jgi:hypothetical protein